MTDVSNKSAATNPHPALWTWNSLRFSETCLIIYWSIRRNIGGIFTSLYTTGLIGCKFWTNRQHKIPLISTQFVDLELLPRFLIKISTTSRPVQRTATHIHWSRRTGKTLASIWEDCKRGGLVIFQAFFTKYKETPLLRPRQSVRLSKWCDVILATETFVGFHATRR